MSCSINIPFTSNLDYLYNLGIVAAIEHGGQISGNKATGTFIVPALGGKFEGSYNILNNQIEIYIVKKPLLIPCALIETFLRLYIK